MIIIIVSSISCFVDILLCFLYRKTGELSLTMRCTKLGAETSLSLSDLLMLILLQYLNHILDWSSIVKKRVMALMIVWYADTSLMWFTMLRMIFSMSLVIEGDSLSSAVTIDDTDLTVLGGSIKSSETVLDRHFIIIHIVHVYFSVEDSVLGSPFYFDKHIVVFVRVEEGLEKHVHRFLPAVEELG